MGRLEKRRHHMERTNQCDYLCVKTGVHGDRVVFIILTLQVVIKQRMAFFCFLPNNLCVLLDQLSGVIPQEFDNGGTQIHSVHYYPLIAYIEKELSECSFMLGLLWWKNRRAEGAASPWKATNDYMYVADPCR